MRPWKLFAVIAVPLVIAMTVRDLFAEEAARPVPAAIAAKFAKLDRDADKRLSADEYRASTGQTAESLRDFDLFDRDADDYLSLEEYWSLPTHPLAERGPLPDPLTAVVEQFVGVMDQFFGNWDQEPNRTVPVNKFLAELSKTLEEPNAAQMQREADPNRDQQVTRDEARRFVEIRTGVCRSDGKPIRESNGRIYLQIQFQYADRDHDDRINLAELVEHGFLGANAAETFQTNDLNRDGFLSWEEWCGFRSLDPILDFRSIDANLDGQIDPAEFLVGMPEYFRLVAKFVFPAFDTDRNGTLSLDEYRLTMHCNQVAHWGSVVVDTDGDGVLSLAEFRFENAAPVPVLRFVYFGLHDLNHDGVLDPKEFPFKTKARREVYSLNADGSDYKRLFGVEAFPMLGSPSVSPDGKWIAFDAHGPKKTLSEQKLVITDLEGGQVRDMGFGIMPNWSHDGRQLSYSWQGIRIIDADTKESKQVAAGWGAKWSPDGKRLLYYAGLNIYTLDVATEKSTVVYNARGDGYQQIFWNMAWSPDSRRICFKGLKPNGAEELATITADPDKPQLKVHHSGKAIAECGFPWHPDGNRLIFCSYCRERDQFQLYEVNPNTDDPAQLVKGQDPKTPNYSACWTPDGKRLLVITGDYE